MHAEKLRFFDKQMAYDEFKRLYPDTPELVDTLTPDMMPTSYRVVPRTDDSNVIDGIGAQFQKKAGVQDVVYAKQSRRSGSTRSRTSCSGCSSPSPWRCCSDR